ALLVVRFLPVTSRLFRRSRCPSSPFSICSSADRRALHSFPTRRSSDLTGRVHQHDRGSGHPRGRADPHPAALPDPRQGHVQRGRSEEQTSELQSRENLVCRLLLETKNITDRTLTFVRFMLFGCIYSIIL